MADEHDPHSDVDVFDIERIRKLIELMKEHDLSEVELRHAPRRIKLRRGAELGPTMMLPPMGANMAAMPPVVNAGGASSGTSSGSSSGAAQAAPEENVTIIRSPMVGTFYTRPTPDAAPFVKVGDQVNEDTIVCLIEAMKMFNEIPAGVSGKIVAVMVQNEEAVDVNKPLFKVAPG